MARYTHVRARRFGGEVAASLHGSANSGVDALNGVCRVDHLPYRVVEEPVAECALA